MSNELLCLAWDCASHASYVRGTHGRSQSQTLTWPRGQNHLCWVQVTRIANQCTDRVLRLCSVVRSVFVQPIANYPLLIAENSDKISEERSQLWNSDRFFANNNKLIGTLLTFKEWKKNYPVRQANKIFLLPSFFLIIAIISWFPIPFPPSVTSCWFLINILVLYPCNVI